MDNNCVLPVQYILGVLRLQYAQLFPDPRFLLFVLQNMVGYKNEIKCVRMSASAIRPFPAIMKGKTPFDSDGSKAGLFTIRDSGPTRYECVPR